MVGPRQHTDYVSKANQYIADVLAGTIPACKWVKLACQRQLNDLAKQDTPDFPFVFDPVAANRACKFIEKFPHVQGFKGKLRLEGWQCFITTCVFGWLRAGTTLRRFRRVYTEVPRGNGKSAWTAPIGLYMGFMDGEPGAEVYVAAVTRDQTDHVFKLAAQPMARNTPEFLKRYGIEVNSNTITQASTSSLFRALASKTNSLDSLNIHFGIIDELHAHPTPEVYQSLDSGTGKRDNSMLWMITTAGSNRAGICYDRRDYITKILSGVVQADTWFGIIYTIDDDDDWATEEACRRANPNWGISVKPSDVLPKLGEAMQLASAAPNFKTKHLNVWVGADAAWMDMTRFGKCADEKLEEEQFLNQDGVVAVDLSFKLDLTATMKLFWKTLPTEVKDKETGAVTTQDKVHYYAFGTNWTPEARIEESRNSQYRGWLHDGWLRTCPGETVDYDMVEAYIREESKRFHLLEVAFDPFPRSHPGQPSPIRRHDDHGGSAATQTAIRTYERA
jgi:phage terminase large subunit-like protein